MGIFSIQERRRRLAIIYFMSLGGGIGKVYNAFLDLDGGRAPSNS